MRLSEQEVAGIKSAVAEVFGAGATVRLFGLRLRDDLKGGDIDLMVDVAPHQTGFKTEFAREQALIDADRDFNARVHARDLVQGETRDENR